MIKYPPYVNAYGKIEEVFKKIKEASVPPKFTQDFLHTSLGLTSSSYRAMIPFLKRLGFIDPSNTPTEEYKSFRDDTQSGLIMASKIKDAYADLFKANEYAYKLTREEIISKLKTILGTAEKDSILPAVAGSFIELVKLSNFEKTTQTKQKKTIINEVSASSNTPQVQPEIKSKSNLQLGISYTINLNLPATTEIEVFNAIFKSLKQNILDKDE